MPRSLMTVLPAFVVLAEVALPHPCQATDLQQPFSIRISTPQNVFKAGSEIRLQIEMTNISDHDILGVVSKGYSDAQEAGYSIEVRDVKGNSPPKTQLQRMLRGEYKQGIGLGGSGPVGGSLSPGKSLKDGMIVNKFYDLGRPGKYSIQVQRNDPTSRIVVKSNTITVTVTP